MPRTSSSRWAVKASSAFAQLANACSTPRHGLATAALTAAAILLAPTSTAHAQDTSAVGPYARAVATWISLVAEPGYERPATDRIISATGTWTRDRMGNLISVSGEGAPRRVIACGLDESGYVVSSITDDGYLRVHMNGNEKHPALWDEYHEGQRVLITTVDRTNPGRTRTLPGVFAVRSNHLWRNRVADTTPTSIENLYVDIGARTRAEAEKMGVDVFSTVTREWPEWLYSSFVAGPAAGNRAGCAAVAAAMVSNNRSSTGETTFIISTQKSFAWSGLTSALMRMGHVDTLFIVDAVLGKNQPIPTAIRAPWSALKGLDVSAVMAIGVRTNFAGTLAESVEESDLQTLHAAVAGAAGVGRTAPLPVQLSHGWTAAPPLIVRDSLSRYTDVLAKLADVYANSGHEQPMRDAIHPLLPAWARDSIVVDDAGNMILAMGPNKDTSVFVAHMDEIGFEVTAVAPNGTVTLRPRGTFFPFLWEGQPALLHRDDEKIPARDGKLGCSASRDGPLRGVFVPRDSSTRREPTTLTAYFGRDAGELTTAGVKPGSMLTGYKCSARLGDMRLTGRSVDDRAGVTALILALDEIEPAKLDHKVIFIFSVREEGGLEGAKAAAAAFGPSVHRVHAVDTFVSSDSPLESHRFAFAPIGQGAVVRALDNSSVTPPDEINDVVKLAKAQNIPLQVGVTNGGNDGSEFVRLGAVDVALAWPLRYSHSPAEVIDLRDL
ncbi:MAG TPA: M20/M25/M40 family metallo-hydrolase, partial [Gemmatimonadaceae bacterium]